MIYRLNDFGKELKEIRSSMGLSQIDVRDIVNISEDTLRRIENGKTKPRMETLDLLSIAYKRNLYLILDKYRDTPISYIERTIENVIPYIRTLNFKKIDELYDTMINQFNLDDYSQYKKLYIKINQYHEYISSLRNMYNSFTDESREDLIKLINILGISPEKISLNNKELHFDILEIRIVILIALIYRIKKEFNSAERLLITALSELEKKHSEEKKFLYFYLLITTNLMTVYHRTNKHYKVRNYYKAVLRKLDNYYGAPNVASLFIRNGVSNYRTNMKLSNEYINIALDILNKTNNDDIALEYIQNFSDLYDFFEITID